MSDENLDSRGSENKEAIQYTDAEVKAMESGWVPKDQWEGDPDAWRPAKEFNDRGELFRKIDDQNRTVKELKKALEDMKRHHAAVRETEYARALSSLKAQKKTALEEGDAAQVIQLDDQIDLVKEEQNKLKEQPIEVQATANPEFVNWVDKNKWYETNESMRAYADTLGRNLAQKGYTPTQVLAEVAKQVRQDFPTKFSNPNRDKPAAVEGSSSKGGKNEDNFVLSDEQRRVMQRFVRSGAMSEKEYIAELKRIQGV